MILVFPYRAPIGPSTQLGPAMIFAQSSARPRVSNQTTNLNITLLLKQVLPLLQQHISLKVQAVDSFLTVSQPRSNTELASTNYPAKFKLAWYKHLRRHFALFSLFVKFWDVGPTCHLYWLLYLSMTNDSNYSLYLNWFSLNWFIFSWQLQTNTRTTWVFKFEALPKPNCIHSNVKETPTRWNRTFSFLQPSLPWWSAGLTFSLAKGRRRDGNSNYVQDIYSQDFRDDFMG